MQGNDFCFHWYSMLTNNAYKKNISVQNLLNKMETGEHDILFCNRKVNAGVIHLFS